MAPLHIQIVEHLLHLLPGADASFRPAPKGLIGVQDDVLIPRGLRVLDLGAFLPAPSQSIQSHFALWTQLQSLDPVRSMR